MDIFSAALITWYLLTGHRPAVDIRADAMARPDLAPARARWPAVAALAEAMWAHEPEARPSAGDALASLGALPDAPRPLTDPTCCAPS